MGKRLAALRTLADPPLGPKELDQLADLTGGHCSKLERLEAGQVSAKTVFLLANVLGTTMDWLYAGLGRSPSANDVRRAVKRIREAK